MTPYPKLSARLLKSTKRRVKKKRAKTKLTRQSQMSNMLTRKSKRKKVKSRTKRRKKRPSKKRRRNWKKLRTKRIKRRLSRKLKRRWRRPIRLLRTKKLKNNPLPSRLLLLKKIQPKLRKLKTSSKKLWKKWRKKL